MILDTYPVSTVSEEPKETKSDPNKPKSVFVPIKFVKEGESVKTVKDEKPVPSVKSATPVKPSTPKTQTEEPKNVNQETRGVRRDWGDRKPNHSGLGYRSPRKTCFVYGSKGHLIKNCNFHEHKMNK